MSVESAAATPRGPLRLAELLGPLSLVTDMGMGAPDETALRTCLLATGLARHMGLPEGDVADVYYTALVKHLGCTATAHDEAARFGGDELVIRPLIGSADSGKPREMLGVVARAGASYRPARRVAVAFRMATSARWGRGIEAAVCEVAAMLAARLGMTPAVQAAVGQLFERWDGRGNQHLAGQDIARPARFAVLAERASRDDRRGGPDVAIASVRQASGRWFDPEIASAFLTHGAGLLVELRTLDPLPAVLQAEPAPHVRVPLPSIDNVARVFADMADLKSPFTAGHSPGVAELAGSTALRLDCPPATVDQLRRAAMFHDLGRVGVPSGIWDKPAALTTAERERMQMHPYYSERILARVPSLASVAPIAGMHHERLDGSGYHRGARGREIPLLARVLAASDAFHAMIEHRPHRPAIGAAEAAETLLARAAEGTFDTDVARAVAECAGHSVAPRRVSTPAGLSVREVEVLRLLCRGLSNRAIAEELVISPRTAEHHVQHIYDKIGVSTRAGACMFAMQHDLLPLVNG